MFSAGFYAAIQATLVFCRRRNIKARPATGIPLRKTTRFIGAGTENVVLPSELKLTVPELVKSIVITSVIE